MGPTSSPRIKISNQAGNYFPDLTLAAFTSVHRQGPVARSPPSQFSSPRIKQNSSISKSQGCVGTALCGPLMEAGRVGQPTLLLASQVSPGRVSPSRCVWESSPRAFGSELVLGEAARAGLAPHSAAAETPAAGLSWFAAFFYLEL